MEEQDNWGGIGAKENPVLFLHNGKSMMRCTENCRTSNTSRLFRERKVSIPLDPKNPLIKCLPLENRKWDRADKSERPLFIIMSL